MEVLMFVHILSGGIGLASGSAAMIAAKGGRLHRLAGNIFFPSMLFMAMIGGYIAASSGHRVTVLAAMLTAYLVASGWITVRRVEARRAWGLLSTVAGGSVAAFGMYLGLEAGQGRADVIDASYVVPATIYFFFAGVAALGVAGDLAMILRRDIGKRMRVLRHLWRMCFALYIAASSFFTGQQDVFPESIRGSFLLEVPELTVLGLMLFWLAFVTFSGRFASPARTRSAVPAE